MRRGLPYLIAAFVVASGCFGAGPRTAEEPARPGSFPKVERPLFHLEQILPFSARSADGTALRGHVYLPNGSGPFATIVDLSPYWNTGEGRSDKQEAVVDGRRTMSPLYRPFLDAGFAVALMALRGSGGSDGCFQMGSRLDGKDGYAIVETLAAQPWSNGAVGMYGISYAGWTQYLTMAEAPPHLRAILPVSGVIDYWSLLTRNGASISTTPLLQAEYHVEASGGLFISTGLLLILFYSDYYSTNPENIVPDVPSPEHFPCAEHVTNTPPNLQLGWTGDRGPWFDERDYRADIATTTIPIFATNGMTDGEGHIQQFNDLWPILPAHRRLLLGQWDHLFPQMGGRDDFNDMAVAWFDHYLYGAPPRLAAGVVEYQDSDGDWHESGAWPPPGQNARLWLSAGSLVTEEASVTASSQSLQSAPLDPTLEQCGPHQVLFTSPPVHERVLLAGNFWLNATITSNLPDGNYAAYLFRTPNGGGCPDAEAREVRRILSDLRHWEGTGFGRDFPTDRPTPIQYRSLPFASTLEAGERLVLAIGGYASELTPDPRMPRLTVTTGPGVMGTLDLHVVEGNLVFEG